MSKKTNFPLFSDRYFRALVEKSWDAVVLVDKRGKVLFATPSVERMFGRKYDEITGISGFKYVHPADLPRILKLLANIVIRPGSALSAELRIKHKLGHYRWVEAVSTNLLMDREVGALVVNFHDITERKELEERKDEFISIAGHELRTPLTTIKIITQLLIKNLSSDSKSVDLLGKVEFQTERLQRLVDDLLNVARIQEGKVILEKQRFKLDNLIKDVVEEYLSLNKSHQIEIRGKTKKPIFADKFKLHQVISNLISNAVKYSPKANLVKVNIREKKETIDFSVQDFGFGISKKDQQNVFERFYQAESKKKSKTEGLGLGLFIASNIVKEHGGTIGVKSERGIGSIFIVSLPKSKKSSLKKR